MAILATDWHPSAPVLYAVTAVALVLNVLWYVMVIHRGFRERVLAVPPVSVLFYFSYDLTVISGGFTSWLPGVPLQTLGFFALLDLAPLLQIVLYGPAHFRRVKPRTFYLLLIIALAVLAPVLPLLVGPLHDTYGLYTAALTELSISFLYPAMLYTRGNLTGQSVAIATVWFIQSLTTGAWQLVVGLRVGLAHMDFVLYTVFASVVASGVYLVAVRNTQRNLAITAPAAVVDR
ncbi:hypothetical protein CG740_38015 [Streptomyces sp. CB01201]|uniref:hypothetical protein n=1 Tax=Streptomyces sp. CB01201 TaxID=2020324 RepID=UPI000C27BC6E|nr:hypothetical protein [Streptomyces sp. CB01201]PJM97976.1 hypothetical protein CG740_38015 [Streptomyces sp. CB01201]